MFGISRRNLCDFGRCLWSKMPCVDLDRRSFDLSIALCSRLFTENRVSSNPTLFSREGDKPILFELISSFGNSTSYMYENMLSRRHVWCPGCVLAPWVGGLGRSSSHPPGSWSRAGVDQELEERGARPQVYSCVVDGLRQREILERLPSLCHRQTMGWTQRWSTLIHLCFPLVHM